MHECVSERTATVLLRAYTSSNFIYEKDIFTSKITKLSVNITPSILSFGTIAKGSVVIIRKSKKNGQHNGQTKKYKRTNNDLKTYT
jgi:hypothetical protein